MEARYRQDYPGEFVILETKWSQGKKTEKREWIENPIQNQHLSGRAACISSNVDFDTFNFRILESHRGGLLGSKKLQTYGTAKVAHTMRLDFSVDTNYSNLTPLLDNRYVENNIVYTTAKNCIKNPGEFYLIPLMPQLSPEALPLYLASFDGHQEIYMLGYTNETIGGTSNWIQDVTSVIKAYSGTTFIMVGNEKNMPEEWLACPNTQNFTYRHFISYCDV